MEKINIIKVILKDIKEEGPTVDFLTGLLFTVLAILLQNSDSWWWGYPAILFGITCHLIGLVRILRIMRDHERKK